MPMSTSRFINRELSWLEFNQRVLEESENESVPLLERLKFLAITASNLDEFYMVRVGSLEDLAVGGITVQDPSGLTPAEQLLAIARRVRQMLASQYAGFTAIDGQLTEAGIRRVLPTGLNDRQKSLAGQIFDNEIYPIFTPQAVSAAEDFPLLASGTLNLAVRIECPDGTPADRVAVIPFGRSATRFYAIPVERGYAYLLLEDIVAMHVGKFFPGERILECVPFRITRNADLELREDQAADLLSYIEQSLEARRSGQCVRIEVADAASEAISQFLRDALQVREANYFAISGPIDLSAFMQLTELNGFDALRYEPWPPQPSPELDATRGMFEQIARRDVMLQHPFESFEPVVRFVEEAANDPDVLAIKQTLYRTSRNSPIVAALARAAQRGKNVTVIVELQARFDEARNIEWARNLERSDVQVIYGVKGLKTHAKVCLVIRREPQGIQRYVHFGTGNYNESTARIYSDISLFTCDEQLGADATTFFNAVCGRSLPQEFHRIAAAPLGLRNRLTELIQSEAQRKQPGQKPKITAKLNSLVDPELIQALYQASQAGVKIRLNVRGICCLRPGVAGLSENITVISVVDRLLEHARILHFSHGGDDRVYISSADWMPRNLDRRVELLVPVDDPANKRRLITILETYFQDTAKARKLQPDGHYQRVIVSSRKAAIRSQEALYQQVCQTVKQAIQSQRTIFEPHRAPGSEGP